MADLNATLKRVKDIGAELVAAETRLTDAKAEQDTLKAKLEETYGTSDVEQLKGILAEKEGALSDKLTEIDGMLNKIPQA